MNLELKHLAPYLPYELKVIQIDTQKNRTLNLCGLTSKLRYQDEELKEDEKHLKDISEITYWVSEFKSVFGLNSNAHLIKPILRPMSDLTIEQTIDFFDFGSLDLEIIDINQWHSELIEELKTNQKFQLSQFNKLFKWHLDIYGLIPSGSAISIHDVGQVIA